MPDHHADICMAGALEFLALDEVLGLFQRLSPGPLAALVISEAFKFGKEEGFKVAVSPLITDSTIIVLAPVVLSNLAKYTGIIEVVPIRSACCPIFVAVQNLSQDDYVLSQTVRSRKL